MAFKGMEDRFNANMKAIYNAFSTRDGSSDGQPFLEIKPDNLQYDATNDTYSLPIASIERDVVTVGGFLKSNDGLIFLGKQALLQTGNAISETRLINPLFVIANLQPFVHFDRSVSSPSDFAITDPTAAPDSLDPKIGYAGRMQTETANAALANVLGSGGGISGLLGLLSLSSIISTVTSAFHVDGAGATGVDQRPELNVDGLYYSIQMNHGFQSQISPQNYYDSALKSLKSGDIQGAYTAIKGVANAAENIVSDVGSAVSSLFQGNLSGVSNALNGNTAIDDINTNAINGSRYFITNKTDANRYLKNSISDTGLGTAWFLDRDPTTISGILAVPYATANPVFNNLTTPSSPISASVAGSNSSISIGGQAISLPDLTVALTPSATSLDTTVANIQQNASQQLANDVRSLRGQIPQVVPPVSIAGIDLTGLTLPATLASPTDNPAEDNMLYENLSLTTRYNDDHFSAVRNAIATQMSTQDSYWSRSDVDTGNMGFTGGIKPGRNNNPTNAYSRSTIGSYLRDGMNNKVFYPNDSTQVISSTTRNNIKKDANDSIMVMFQDYENNRVIPFRAFIIGISENIKPEVNDTRYIGRIERNIVYVGVSRYVSFQLRVQAFAPEELDIMWGKVSYLSGLCFPSGYSNGFMVPPLVKLTIGDMYRDQPGYINNLTNTIENDTSWEIEDGRMVPHGLLIDVSFAIIEKTQLKSGNSLYGFGATVN